MGLRFCARSKEASALLRPKEPPGMRNWARVSSWETWSGRRTGRWASHGLAEGGEGITAGAAQAGTRAWKGTAKQCHPRRRKTHREITRGGGNISGYSALFFNPWQLSSSLLPAPELAAPSRARGDAAPWPRGHVLPRNAFRQRRRPGAKLRVGNSDPAQGLLRGSGVRIARGSSFEPHICSTDACQPQINGGRGCPDREKTGEGWVESC